MIIVGLDPVSDPVAIIGNPKSVDSAPAAVGAPAVNNAPQPAFNQNQTNAAAQPAGTFGNNNPLAAPRTNTMYGNTPQQPQQYNAQPQARMGGNNSNNMMYGGGGANNKPMGGMSMPSGGDPGAITNIDALNPYQNRWTIKARCTSKGEVRHWHNQKGDGKLFSITLMDATGMEIRATMFNDAVDAFENLFQIGSVYTVSRGQVKNANRQYNNTTCLYELTLDASSEIRLLPPDSMAAPPPVTYNPTPIAQLGKLKVKDDIVDVIAVATLVAALGSITTKKDGRQISKRNLTLADASGAAVELTLWGELAQKSEWDSLQGTSPIVAFRGLRVGDYGGVSLSTVSSTHMEMNPDIAEAVEVRQWFMTTGGVVQSLTSAPGAGGGEPGYKHDRATCSELAALQLGMGETKWNSLRASVSFVKHDGNFMYPACPTEGCNKKVVDIGPSQWRCEKCDKNFDSCDMRYMLAVAVNDYTGSVFVRGFNELGQLVLGQNAGSLQELKNQNESAYEAVFQDALFKDYVLKIKSTGDNYNDQATVRHNVASVAPIDYEKESSFLLSEIRTLMVA